MSYIGNQPISAAFLTDTFSGTGSQTAFTMTVAPANTSSIIVAVTGVLQSPDTYSVSGTTLTFSTAPPSGTSNISVRYLGIPASGVTTTAYRTVTNTTATAGQTSFTIPSYTVGYVDVYRNGVYLPTSDYTATTGTTVVLTNAATVGDTITTISFYVSSVLNAIPATAGSVSDSYIVSMSSSKLTGTQTIPKATLPTGSVLQVVSSTLTTYTSSTSTADVSIGLSASITPSSASSKVFVMYSLQGSTTNSFNATLYRGASTICTNTSSPSLRAVTSSFIPSTAGVSCLVTQSQNFLDSPATTSATTYEVKCNTNSGTFYVNRNDGTAFGSTSTITLMEISA